MVNKKGVEIVHFVCLSCHFDMGLFHILGQEVPQLMHLMILLCLQWYLIELALFPKLSNTWCKYLYSRGMRHSTHSLSSTLLIFAFTLTLIIQDAMIGGQWELDTNEYLIAIINLSRRVWKLDETYACFTSTHIYIFPKCTPIIFRFSSTLYDHCRMFYLSLCMHVFHITCYHVTLCELSMNILVLNTWYHFINYLHIATPLKNESFDYM